MHTMKLNGSGKLHLLIMELDVISGQLHVASSLSSGKKHPW